MGEGEGWRGGGLAEGVPGGERNLEEEREIRRSL